MSPIAIVIAGGPEPDLSVARRLPEHSVVIAADSGLDHARALGLRPNIVIGDLDSVSADGLHWAQEIGATVVEHPQDKDATDLDLALSAASDLAERIVVIDSGSGRADHALANLLLLASPRFAGVELTAHVGGALMTVVHHARDLEGTVGEYVSLVALGGLATGVSTAGLAWTLDNADLEPGSTLGVSNQFAASAATISVGSGVVLAVQPVASS